MGVRKYILVVYLFILFCQIAYADTLLPYLIDPLLGINVTQNEFFNFTIGIKCMGGDCGNVTATLDPKAEFCGKNPCCRTAESPCIAGSNLLMSADNATPIPEPHAPNTIDNCTEWMDNPSILARTIENITITDLDEDQFKRGDKVRVDVWMYCIDRYRKTSIAYTNSTNRNPFVLLRNISCPNTSVYSFELLSANISLDNIGGNHTIRALALPRARATVCATNSYDEQDDLTLLVLGDKGVIPMNSGTPFYTINQNPVYPNDLPCLQNMKENNSCNITWTVNATGNIGEEYKFFAIFESNNPDVNKSETERVNIKIIAQAKEDTIPPFVIIHSPQNITYNELNINLNVTANKTIDKWMYNLNDNGDITFIPNTTITAIEGNNYLVVYANDTAGNIGKNNVSFIVKLYNKFNISLIQGWNLISFPLNLTNKSINHIFNNINFKSIFSYGSWNYYFNETNNNFNTINEANGYWINSLNNQTLTIEGKEFDSMNLSLKQGWNLIGYPSLNSSLINETLEDINYSVVYSYNNSNWLGYIPNRNDSLNTLKYFIPGYGYWVWVK